MSCNDNNEYYKNTKIRKFVINSILSSLNRSNRKTFTSDFKRKLEEKKLPQKVFEKIKSSKYTDVITLLLYNLYGGEIYKGYYKEKDFYVNFIDGEFIDFFQYKYNDLEIISPNELIDDEIISRYNDLNDRFGIELQKNTKTVHSIIYKFDLGFETNHLSKPLEEFKKYFPFAHISDYSKAQIINPKQISKFKYFNLFQENFNLNGNLYKSTILLNTEGILTINFVSLCHNNLENISILNKLFNDYLMTFLNKTKKIFTDNKKSLKILREYPQMMTNDKIFEKINDIEYTNFYFIEKKMNDICKIIYRNKNNLFTIKEDVYPFFDYRVGLVNLSENTKDYKKIFNPNNDTNKYYLLKDEFVFDGSKWMVTKNEWFIVDYLFSLYFLNNKYIYLLKEMISQESATNNYITEKMISDLTNIRMDINNSLFFIKNYEFLLDDLGTIEIIKKQISFLKLDKQTRILDNELNNIKNHLTDLNKSIERSNQEKVEKNQKLLEILFAINLATGIATLFPSFYSDDISLEWVRKIGWLVFGICLMIYLFVYKRINKLK